MTLKAHPPKPSFKTLNSGEMNTERERERKKKHCTKSNWLC